MIYHLKDTEAVRVRSMAPGTCFIMDGSLYMRTEDVPHGGEMISAVHLESGALMEVLPEDMAVPLQIEEVTLS